jgi:hyperosmotically inducible protein
MTSIWPADINEATLYSRGCAHRIAHDAANGPRTAPRIDVRRNSVKDTAMKLKHLAPLMLIIGLATPLVSQGADKGDSDRAAAKAWVKDSVITTKIKTELAANKPTSLAMVHVDTDANGDVTLTGKVDTRAEQHRAEAIARSVEGVKSVDNNLIVTGK